MSNEASQGKGEAPEGVILYRELGDGRAVCVTPQLFDAAIVTIGPAEDKGGYDHQWQYSEEVGGLARAVMAAMLWTPGVEEEPQGWTRTDYKAQRARYRRRPDGTPASEYEGD